MEEQISNDDLARKKREITRLINSGFNIDLSYNIITKQKGLFGWLKPKIKERKTESFLLKELTLNIIDRINLISLDIDFDKYKDLDPRSADKEISKDHLKRICEIVALCLIAENYEYQNDNGKYIQNNKELKRVSNILLRAVKPSDVLGILQLIDVVGNLGDFTNSIRLIVSTQKRVNLIEGNPQD